jgi:hypothetical protein
MANIGLFSTELRVFEKHRQDWSRWHSGEYVVIRDEVIAEEFFGTYTEALKASLKKFGARRGFLVKQIWVTEPVYRIS